MPTTGKYQFKKKAASKWKDCSKKQFEAYNSYPLSLNYITRELEAEKVGKQSPLTKKDSDK